MVQTHNRESEMMGGMKGATRQNGELTRKGAALKRWGCS